MWYSHLIENTFRLFGPGKGLLFVLAFIKAPFVSSRRSRAVYESLGLCHMKWQGRDLYWRHPDVGMISEIFLNHSYDAFPEFAVHSGTWVLDAGAHLGTFTVLAALHGATVVAIEPETQNFRFLLDNMNANDLRNVRPFNKALWSSTGRHILYMDKSATGANTMVSQVANQRTIIEQRLVDTVSITRIAEILGVPRFDLAKLDIEGAEFEVLDFDALEHLDRLVMEIHPGAGDIQMLVNRIRHAGFNVLFGHGKGVFQHQVYLYARRTKMVSSTSGGLETDV